MKPLNVSYVNSKLLIDNNLVTILDTIKTMFFNYSSIKIEEFYANMMEFKIFNVFIKYLHYFIAKNIKFTIGFNLYNNLFYIFIINYNIFPIDENLDVFKYPFFTIEDDNDEIIEYPKMNLNKVISTSSISKVYLYHDDMVIKICQLTKGLNEYINYLKLFYKLNDLARAFSFRLVEFLKIILIKIKDDNQKFMIGIVMKKYLTIDNILSKIMIKQNIINLINDIKLLNKSNIVLMDLKNSNILWDPLEKQFILIDFDGIQIDFTKNNYITSIYNTHIDILLGNPIIENYDIYGLVDIILYIIGISWNKFLIEMMLVNKYSGTLKEFRIYLHQSDNSIIINMVKIALINYYKKNFVNNLKLNNNDFIKLISLICKSTINYDVLFELIRFI